LSGSGKIGGLAASKKATSRMKTNGCVILSREIMMTILPAQPDVNQIIENIVFGMPRKQRPFAPDGGPHARLVEAGKAIANCSRLMQNTTVSTSQDL
jgi:hypothetical protein